VSIGEVGGEGAEITEGGGRGMVEGKLVGELPGSVEVVDEITSQEGWEPMVEVKGDDVGGKGRRVCNKFCNGGWFDRAAHGRVKMGGESTLFSK